MTSVPYLFDVAARVAGAGVTVVGLELAVAWPKVEAWRRAPLPGGRWAALALACLGAGFVIFPELCLAGGGIVAAAAIFYFVVACEPAGDGSDVMLVLVLAGLGASDLMPFDWMRTVAWWCLAVNVCLAYWWSGVAKTRVPAWRAGRQVALALNSPRYGSPAVAREFLDHQGAAKAVSWSVIGLEAACPAFLVVGGPALWVWAFCALLMHLGIALMMGLGRFLWAFSAGLLCLLAVRGTV